MKYKNIALIFTLSFFLCAEEKKIDFSPENTLFFIDLDGVVSDETINLYNFLGALGLLILHPTLPFHYAEIVQKRKKLTQEHVDGATNIIFTLLKWLEEEKKYTNLTQWTEYLTTAYVCPTPKNDMLKIIQQLKEKGFTVLFATNQDTHQFSLYRKRMHEKGHNLKQLFDGGISTRTHNQKSCAMDHNKETTWHVTEYIKPQQEYFEMFKKLIALHKPDCTKKQCNVIFIDDIKHHAENAKKEGIHGIHFSSADQLKKDLSDFGIKL